MKIRAFAICTALSILCSLCAIPSGAQTVTATLQGQVHDHGADRRRGRESCRNLLSVRAHAAGRAKADRSEGIDRDVGGRDFLGEDLRQALLAFRETYNTTWLINRHGYLTPSRFREKQLQPLAAAA